MKGGWRVVLSTVVALIFGEEAFLRGIQGALSRRVDPHHHGRATGLHTSDTTATMAGFRR